MPTWWHPGSTNLDYIVTSMPAADAVNWFGKVPPDLSLIARSQGPGLCVSLPEDLLRRSQPAHAAATIWRYPSAAMPAVLSDLEGVNEAVGRQVGNDQGVRSFRRPSSPGNMTAEQFDGFVRDTVNFLDYVGEPAQVERRSMGIWVVLFLLLLSARLAAEERILERRALSVRRTAARSSRSTGELIRVQPPLDHDAVFSAR